MDSLMVAVRVVAVRLMTLRVRRRRQNANHDQGREDRRGVHATIARASSRAPS
jgi:hypothetical protein